MSAMKPVIVLVHGAWHDSTAWNSVTPELEKIGFETRCVGLASTGIRDPPVETHLEDAALIRQAVKEIVGSHKDVVLVAHSYGGAPVSDSVQDLEKKAGVREHGIVGAVFLAAYMLPRGKSMRDVSGPYRERFGGGIDPKDYTTLEDTPQYYNTENPEMYFYNDLPAREAKKYTAGLRPQARGPMLSQTESEAWQYVPCTAIICTQDLANQPELQRQNVELARQNAKYPIQLREIDSSHSPMVLHVSEVVQQIEEAANEAVRLMAT